MILNKIILYKQFVRKIRRQIQGYHRQNKFYEPLIEPDFEPIENFYSISFLDLIKLLHVNEFLKFGVSLNTVKYTHQKACKIWKTEHPFSTRRFKIDGKIILAENENETFLHIIKDRYALRKILNPFLFDAYDFKDDLINRFWPLGKERSIVLDPRRNFGRPIIDKECVPVKVLVDSFKTEKSINVIARCYEVEKKSVKDTVDYYKNLTA